MSLNSISAIASEYASWPVEQPGDPDPDGLVRRLGRHDLGKYRGLQRLEHLRIAKEAGDVDEEVVVERLDFLRVAQQPRRVLRHRLLRMNRHPPHDAALDGGVAVEAEVHVRDGPDRCENPSVALFGRGLGFVGGGRVRDRDDRRGSPGARRSGPAAARSPRSRCRWRSAACRRVPRSLRPARR